MKAKKLLRRGNRSGLLLFAAASACLMVAGCASFGSISLNSAVIKYDQAVLDTEQESLLLNILRMHDDQPPHFTSASSVAATFTLSSPNTLSSTLKNIGTPPASLDASLGFGGTFTESPTITITPMQGKDFAARLLSPIDTKFVNMILLQYRGDKLDKMLRLVAAEFVMMNPTTSADIFEMIKNSKGKTNNKEFETVKDFKGIEKGEYTYPFADVARIIRDTKLPGEEKKKQEMDLLKDKGFEFREANCLLKNGCFIKNKPPKIKKEEGKYDREDDVRNYSLFRKIVLHLKALTLCKKLYISFIDIQDEGIKGTYRKHVDFGKEGFKDTVELLEKQYLWQEASEQENMDNSKKEKKDVTKIESEITKEESTKVSKKDDKEVIKTESKEEITRSEKKEANKPDEKESGLMLKKNYTITVLTDVDYDSINYNDYKKLVNKINEDLEINKIRRWGESVIVVLVRGGYPKDSWPIYGYFTLRNFTQVMRFLAESVNEDEPGYEIEYDVPPSNLTKNLIKWFNEESNREKLTKGCLENPVKTLMIRNAKMNENTIIKDPLVKVDYKGKSFWIANRQERPQPADEIDPYPLRWDGQVLSMLYEMFQFNRNTPDVTTPSVSIAK